MNKNKKKPVPRQLFSSVYIIRLWNLHTSHTLKHSLVEYKVVAYCTSTSLMMGRLQHKTRRSYTQQHTTGVSYHTNQQSCSEDRQWQDQKQSQDQMFQHRDKDRCCQDKNQAQDWCVRDRDQGRQLETKPRPWSKLQTVYKVDTVYIYFLSTN